MHYSGELAILAQSVKGTLEVQVHALSMADVEVAVRLGRETAADLTACDLQMLLNQFSTVL